MQVEVGHEKVFPCSVRCGGVGSLQSPGGMGA